MKLGTRHVSRPEGRTYNLKNDDSSYERVEQFKCLGTFLICQNSIQEEIKSRLKKGNS